MPELLGLNIGGNEDDGALNRRINRRKFIKGAVAAAAGVAGAAAFPTVRDTLEEILNPEGLAEQIAKNAVRLRKLYDIDVKSKSGPIEELLKQLGDVSDQEASLAKFNRSLEYLLDVFSKYPQFFVKLLKIRSIVVDDSLAVASDTTVRGTTFNKESGRMNSMFIEISEGRLDLKRWFGWKEGESFRQVFNHEFFHAVVNTLNENSGGALSLDWLAVYAPDAFKGDFAKNKKGFVSDYSQKDSIEDRAETFGAMLTGSENIWQRSEEDKALEKKVKFLQRVMFSNTFGLCNSEYWGHIKNGTLPADFFVKRRDHLLSLSFQDFEREAGSDDWKKYIYIIRANGLTDEQAFEVFKRNLTVMSELPR